jgi:hypothetical protein
MLSIAQEWQKQAKDCSTETLAQSIDTCQSLANDCLLLQQRQENLETQLQVIPILSQLQV